MKFIKQFSIILIISLIGEALHYFIPLPVPASIYGLLIMLAGLYTKLIPLDSVREASFFLIDIMPLMFIPAAVGLLDSWGLLRPILVPFLVHHTGLHSGGHGRHRENHAVFYKI